MAEYIEREALMRQIKEIHCADCNSYHGVRCRACWVDDTFGYIESEPAADVVPVRHGRWINHTMIDGHIHAECSECHKVRIIDNYCPNCGCRMDGGAE